MVIKQPRRHEQLLEELEGLRKFTSATPHSLVSADCFFLLLLALLLLLLHTLDQVPDQVAGFALHLDRVALVRVVEFQEVLDLPDVGQCTTQQLHRTHLLLLLLTLGLLLLALLLVALRHRDLLTTRSLSTSILCTVYTPYASK
jgi:hypothetical protein